MVYSTTLTSKGQFTVPKPIRDRLAVKQGTKFEVVYTAGGFIARPKAQLAILELEGILKKYDDGKPTKKIIEEALKSAAREIVEE